MNDQPKPIFEIVIPAIQANNTKYWIYGGIANAAMVGSCYRSNPDVDFFVLEEDYEKTEEIIRRLCEANGWKIRKTFLNSRPKIDIYISKNGNGEVDKMSVVPIFARVDCIRLTFAEGSKEYPLDFLKQERRHLDGFTFYTLNDEFLRRLFIEYLDSKRKYPLKRIDDARQLLDEEVFRKYFPNENYEHHI